MVVLLLLLREGFGQRSHRASLRQFRERRKWRYRYEREQNELSIKNLTETELRIRNEIAQRAKAYRLPQLTTKRKIRFSSGEFRAAGRQLLVSPEQKLVICAIPKIACTEFMRLMYRLRGDADWQMSPHFRSDTLSLANFDIDRATEIMNDPSWTKAVFLRDPLRRLLSAYLDKFVHAPNLGLHADYGLKFFHKKDLSFAEFVHFVSNNNTKRSNPSGLHLGTNQHWKPQRFMCSLEKFAPVFHFIGRYENIQQHSQSLLRSLGLWEKFGRSGWAPVRSSFLGDRRKRRFSSNPMNSTVKLRDSIFARNSASHRTNSDFRYTEHYTPELEALAKNAYELDYEFLNVLHALPHMSPTSGVPWARFIENRLDHRHLCAIEPQSFGDYCTTLS